MKLKRLITMVGLSTLMITSPVLALAAAPQISFGGGGEQGQYIQFAETSCESLGKIFDCQAKVTGGSGDNKDRIIAGTLDFGLAMGGLAQNWEKNDPAFQENVQIVRYIAGEALFAYGKPEIVEALVNWQGVKDNAFLVSFAAPSELSGDYLTLKELQAGEGNPLADATVTPYEKRSDQVAAVINGKAQLGFAAQFPNPKNSFFQSIADNKLTVMSVVDVDLALNSELYAVREVQLENASLMKWSKGNKIETMYVPVAILARNPESYGTPREQKIQAAAIKRIRNMPEADLLPKAGWLTEFVNKTTDVSANALEDMGKKMKEAAKSAKSSVLGGS